MGGPPPLARRAAAASGPILSRAISCLQVVNVITSIISIIIIISSSSSSSNSVCVCIYIYIYIYTRLLFVLSRAISCLHACLLLVCLFIVYTCVDHRLYIAFIHIYIYMYTQTHTIYIYIYIYVFLVQRHLLAART